MIYNYWSCGLFVESELELPGLFPAAPGAVDLKIKVGKAPGELQAPHVSRKLGVSIAGDEYLLKIANVASYYVSGKSLITIDPCPGSIKEDVVFFLLGTVFSAVLHLHDLIPIQAAAIADEGGLILFCGETGSGKSSQLISFKQQGFPIFSDDFCVLQLTVAGQVNVFPSHPFVQLWGDTFSKVNLAPPCDKKRVRPKLPRYALSFLADFNPVPASASKVVILEPSLPLDHVEISELSRFELFLELNANPYRKWQLASFGKEDLFFQQTASIARNAMGILAKRPLAGDTLTTLTRLIRTRLGCAS